MFHFFRRPAPSREGTTVDDALAMTLAYVTAAAFFPALVAALADWLVSADPQHLHPAQHNGYYPGLSAADTADRPV